jgi:hypothetical protein
MPYRAWGPGRSLRTIWTQGPGAGRPPNHINHARPACSQFHNIKMSATNMRKERGRGPRVAATGTLLVILFLPARARASSPARPLPMQDLAG